MKNLPRELEIKKRIFIEKDKLASNWDSGYGRAQTLARNPAACAYAAKIANCLDTLKSLKPFLQQARDVQICRQLDKMLAQISNELGSIEQALAWRTRAPFANGKYS